MIDYSTLLLEEDKTLVPEPSLSLVKHKSLHIIFEWSLHKSNTLNGIGWDLVKFMLSYFMGVFSFYVNLLSAVLPSKSTDFPDP